MKGKRIVSVLTAAALLITAAAPALAADTAQTAVTGTTASVAAIAESDLTVTAAAASYTYKPTKIVYYSDEAGGGMAKYETEKYTYKNNKLKKYVCITYDVYGSVDSKTTETYSNFNKYGDPKKKVVVSKAGSETTKTVITYTYTYKKGQITKRVGKYNTGGKETATFTYKNGVLRKEVYKYPTQTRTVVYNSKGALKSMTLNITVAGQTLKYVYSNYDKNLNAKTTKVTITSSDGTVTKVKNTTTYKYYKGKYVKQNSTTGSSGSSKIVYSGFVKIKE